MHNAPQEKYSRPPIGRMKRIDQWIRSGRYPNAITMSRDLEVTSRTIKRDIEYMRDSLAAPIEYDGQRRGYRYSQPYDFLPVAQVTEAEAFAVLVADKAIAQYHGTPFQKLLRMAFGKLTAQLDGQEQYSLANLEPALSFRPFAPDDPDLNTFRLITRALQERRALVFEYRNLGAKDHQQRHVYPYHLACIDSHWYLFAHDVSRSAIRTFALTRLSKPSLTTERFLRPKSFSADKYLAGSFGVMKGDKEETVIIEFDAWATDLIRGRQWHSSQELTDLPDGGSRLSLRLSGLEEVERWILSWSTHACVVAPPALRDRIKVAVGSIAKMY